MERVEMVLDPEIDRAYPLRWIGPVEVETTDGGHIVSRVDVPKGDPENTLSRIEIADKVHRLAAFQDAASTPEMDRLIQQVWALDRQSHVGFLLPRCGEAYGGS